MCPEIIERLSHGMNYIYLDVKCPCRHISIVLSLRWHVGDDPYPILRFENLGKVLIIIIY